MHLRTIVSRTAATAIMEMYLHFPRSLNTHSTRTFGRKPGRRPATNERAFQQQKRVRLKQRERERENGKDNGCVNKWKENPYHLLARDRNGNSLGNKFETWEGELRGLFFCCVLLPSLPVQRRSFEALALLLTTISLGLAMGTDAVKCSPRSCPGSQNRV